MEILKEFKGIEDMEEFKRQAKEHDEWFENKICLYGLTQLALILIKEDGIPYYNQVGGYSCYQYDEVGILVPLENERKLLERLSEYTLYKNNLEESDIEPINEIFNTSIYKNYFKVDETKLRNSCEAWIYVDIDNQNQEHLFFKGFPGSKGVITWENSD